MEASDIKSDVLLQVYLQRKYKDKLKKYAREHDHTNMARCKANEHVMLRRELDVRYRNIVKNMKYSQMMSCDTATGVGNNSKVVPKICGH